VKRALHIFILVISTGFAAALPSAVRGDEPPKKVPITVKADKLDYDRTADAYTAVGHVIVEQDGMKIEADKLVLNNKTGEATAEGHVFLQEKGDTVRAEKLQININTKAGLIFKGDLFMHKDNLHLTGDKIERKSESAYRIQNGTFTTCDEGGWFLKADEIDVDMDRYATGSGVSFNMAGLPVFYTPYLLFPVRRQSGLLIPEVGYSSSDGFLMKNSLFWAISDYKDMTLYSDYRDRRGLGTGIEYRYENSRDSGGKLFYNYFDTFKRYRTPGSPDTEWFLSYQHHEEIADDLSVRANINLVSDFSYFTDLEKKLELRSVPYLDSSIFYIERWDTASLNLLGQYAVDLTQESNKNTIQKLPELRYNIYEEKIAGPLHLNFEGSATNFTSQAGKDIMRADLNPRLSASFGDSGLNLTPRAGLHATYYDQGATSTEPTERKYYYAGADLNARFSRVYGTDGDAGFGRMRHSIEPTISYNYIPEVNQSDIPQLDAVDAVTKQNQVDFSLTNRLTAHYKDKGTFRTFDVMVFRLTESYDLNKARVGTSAPAQPRSELRGELYVKTPKILTASALTNYDTYTHSIVSSSEGVTFTGEKVRFNLSRQYLRQPETRFLIGGTGFKLGKWDVDGQVWRDIVQKKTTQKELKLHYASQCWGLGFDYITKPGETQYMLVFDLKGLGTVKMF